MAPRQFASAGGYQDDKGETSEEFCGHTSESLLLTAHCKMAHLRWGIARRPPRLAVIIVRSLRGPATHTRVG